MKSQGARPPRIDTSGVKAAAKQRLRQDGNYRRTAQMIALMMLLTNVPVMLMNYLTAGFIDPGQLDTGALNALNLRMVLFQLLVSMFITPAFELSKTRYMLRTMRLRAGAPGELFDGLGRGSYFTAVRASLWQSVMLYLWMIVPLGMAGQGLLGLIAGDSGSYGLLLIGLILMIIIMINRMLAYSLQFYFLAEQPRMGAIMSLRLSTIAMHGRLRELFGLTLKLLLYILPVTVPNLLVTRLFPGNVAFEIAMSLGTIALYALCYPVVEAANAEYFLRIRAQIEATVAQAQREREAAWPDGGQPGNDDQTGTDDGQSIGEGEQSGGDGDAKT